MSRIEDGGAVEAGLVERLRAMAPTVGGTLSFEGRSTRAMNDDIRRAAAEITRLRAENAGAWHPVTELPDEGRKVVAIYSDGSGAPLLWKHDYGFLDQEGEEVSHDWFYGNVSVWAYLPDSVEFWCENLAEDPITLNLPARMPAEGRDAIEQEGG